ncbi:MAG: hypothetical protein ACI8XM_000235 [Haloarculaceae archaeon]|jgi:hypothetical protein
MGLRDKMGTLRNPAESPQVEAVAHALAGVERDLHEAVQAHYDALGIEPPEDLPPTEERVDALKELVEAQVNGNLWGYWVETHVDLENAQQAAQHAGKDPGEWQDTVERWAANLRQQLDGAEDVPDRDLADRFCQERFGVALGAFEAAVVEWSPGRTMQASLRGPVTADITRIEAATDALETDETEG